MSNTKKIMLIGAIAVCLCAALFYFVSRPDEATQLVIDEITEIENSSPVSLGEINKAKERYNTLSDSQKRKVRNYGKLLKIEDNYEELGLIPLTLENYEGYLRVKGSSDLSDSSGNKVGKEYSSDYITTELLVTRGEITYDSDYDYDYRDVKVTVETRIKYKPYKSSDSENDSVEHEKSSRTVVSCRDDGWGKAYDTIECEDGEFQRLGTSVDYYVIDVSGGVLPVEQSQK